MGEDGTGRVGRGYVWEVSQQDLLMDGTWGVRTNEEPTATWA